MVKVFILFYLFIVVWGFLHKQTFLYLLSKRFYLHCCWSLHWPCKVGFIYILVLRKMNLREVEWFDQLWVFWVCPLSSYSVFKLKYEMLKLIHTFTEWLDNLESDFFQRHILWTNFLKYNSIVFVAQHLWEQHIALSEISSLCWSTLSYHVFVPNFQSLDSVPQRELL